MKVVRWGIMQYKKKKRKKEVCAAQKMDDSITHWN